MKTGGDNSNGRGGGLPKIRSGGSNPLHLDFDSCLRGGTGIPPYAQYTDVATRKATLVVGDFVTWRDSLETFGQTLPPETQRSWHVDVYNKGAGHLGLFRRSRVTGRWFQGRHGVHLQGNEESVFKKVSYSTHNQ